MLRLNFKMVLTTRNENGISSFKIHTCNFKQAFYPFHKLYCVILTTRKYLHKLFVWYLVVKPACVNVA